LFWLCFLPIFCSNGDEHCAEIALPVERILKMFFVFVATSIGGFIFIRKIQSKMARLYSVAFTLILLWAVALLAGMFNLLKHYENPLWYTIIFNLMFPAGLVLGAFIRKTRK
jgi:hypothetical protein